MERRRDNDVCMLSAIQYPCLSFLSFDSSVFFLCVSIYFSFALYFFFFFYCMNNQYSRYHLPRFLSFVLNNLSKLLTNLLQTILIPILFYFSFSFFLCQQVPIHFYIYSFSFDILLPYVYGFGFQI